MYNSHVNLPSIAAVALVIAAILGYVAGVEGQSSPSRGTTSVLATSVLLEYPTGWSAAGAAPAIPGLPILHPTVFAPAGDAAQAGLVSGKLAPGQTGPLPPAFLAALHGPLDATVVNLAESQAYRYSRVTVPGLPATLTLYVLPGLSAGPTALACYASAAELATMGACERIVGTLRLVGQAQSYNLTPDPAYAARLTSVIARLDGQRVALRADMREGATAAAVHNAAGTLAQRFAAAAHSLSHLEPPLAAGQVQLALSGALTSASASYAALAAAAQGTSSSGYSAARASVATAEADVDRALDGFAALAYVRG